MHRKSKANMSVETELKGVDGNEVAPSCLGTDLRRSAVIRTGDELSQTETDLIPSENKGHDTEKYSFEVDWIGLAQERKTIAGTWTSTDGTSCETEQKRLETGLALIRLDADLRGGA